MSAWAYVPSCESPGTPQPTYVAGRGLRIGSNTSARDKWMMVSYDVPFAKCVYYEDNYHDYYYIMIAVKASTFQNTMRIYTVMESAGSYSGVNTYAFIYSYGDFECYGGTGLSQVAHGQENPNIPLYPSEAAALEALNDGQWELPPTDPYGPGGESGTGGGTGTFGGTGDVVGVPTLPTLSAVDTGFITLFKPTLGELNGLANYLWGSLFDISTWKKVFADPMDAILGLSIIPVNPPTSGSANIVVGNIQTSISMPKISSQYVEVDCGTLNIEEYWGAYLDYSPYTKFELYLPYIGTHPISADDIMGDTIQVVYHVDVLSGACVAYVLCGGTMIYTFVGQCSSSIPITGNDWTNVINGTLSIAGSIGTMVATGGVTAPMAVGTIASAVTNSIKPEIEKSGAMSGTGGMLGVQTPYLIVTRPKQCVAKNQNKMIGYPSHIYKPLTDVVGYTEVLSIHLQGVAATDDELTEIVSLLQNGVIF